MNKDRHETVEDYIAAQPDHAQPALKQVRNAIRKAVPRAEESVSYDMPTYKLNGKRLLYFAGWKEHYSLYPASARLVAAFRDELSRCKINKSTLQFPFSEPVPTRTIAEIAKFRAQEINERQAEATTPKKGRSAK